VSGLQRAKRRILPTQGGNATVGPKKGQKSKFLPASFRPGGAGFRPADESVLVAAPQQ
jgi:hypothetical protein